MVKELQRPKEGFRPVVSKLFPWESDRKYFRFRRPRGQIEEIIGT